MRKTVIYIVLCILASSCTHLDLNEIKDANINTSLAVPIGKSEIGIKQLINAVGDSLIMEDSTGGYFITWEEPMRTEEIEMNDFNTGSTVETSMSLSDQNGIKDIFDQLPPDINTADVPAGQNIIFDYNQIYDFDFNKFTEGEIDYTIDSITIKEAYLNIQFDMTGIILNEGTQIRLTISFPTLDGVHGKGLAIQDVFSDNVGELHDNLYSIKVRFSNKETKIPMSYKIEFINASGFRINRDSELHLSALINFINCDEVWGNFRKLEPLSSGEIDEQFPDMGFANMGEDFNVFFKDPVLNINYKSEIRMPIEIEISEMYVQDKYGKKIYAEWNGEKSYSYRITPNSNNIMEGAIVLDKTLGATDKLLSIIPEKIHCSYKVYTARNQSEEESKHYIKFPTTIDLGMAATLPLNFNPGTKIQISDTTAVNMSNSLNGMEAINIEKIDLYTDIENKMPMNMAINIIFIDNEGNKLFSIDDINIKSANVDSQGNAIEATQQSIKIQIEGSDIEEIFNATNIVYQINIEGKDADSSIRLTSEDNIKIKISAFAKAGINVALTSSANNY